jgi:hypothetical protein
LSIQEIDVTTIVMTGAPSDCVEVCPYDVFALGAKSARMGDARPILGDMFVQQDTRFGLAQQLRQRRLPVQELENAQILAIMFDPLNDVATGGSQPRGTSTAVAECSLPEPWSSPAPLSTSLSSDAGPLS